MFQFKKNMKLYIIIVLNMLHSVMVLMRNKADFDQTSARRAFIQDCP